MGYCTSDFSGTNPKPPMAARCSAAKPLQTSVRLEDLRQVRRQLLGVRETLEVAQRRMEVRNGLSWMIFFPKEREDG